MIDFPLETTVHVDLRQLIEETARNLDQAESELFAGRFRELENCALKQQEICQRTADIKTGASDKILADLMNQRRTALAKRVREHTLVFAAVLRRKRRHLEILQRVLNGPSLSYVPPIVNASGREL